MLVCPDGDVERHRFADVVDWFVQECPYAFDNRTDNSPEPDDDGMAQTVSIRGNSGDSEPRVDVESYEVRDDVAGTNSQGASTVSRNCHTSLTCGDDGLRRITPLGNSRRIWG